MNPPKPIFITGSTGYLGQALIAALLATDRPIYALARAASAHRLPASVRVVPGNALDAASYAHAIPHGATLVHLVGEPHPAPWKTAAFEQVDLRSVTAAVQAAQQANVCHFIYVSVVQPDTSESAASSIMRAYQAVRARAETLIHASKIPATIIRPWYVLGPGHRWPMLLLPLYKIAEWVPTWRARAQRVRYVTLAQMVRTLVQASTHPPNTLKIIEVAEILGSVDNDP